MRDDDAVSPTALADAEAAVLDRWFKAFNAHDVDALCAIADPAVEVIPLDRAETAPRGTTYHGRAALRTLLTAGFERFPSMRLDHSAPQRDGTRVTVKLEFVLDDGVAPAVVREASCDYRINDGHIRRMQAYERRRTLDPLMDGGRAGLLSPRERQVLSMLATGSTVGEIAAELVLSPLTVRTHVRNSKDKLQARTTAHAVAIALDEHALDV
jgi:DNA-binding CsgD family transcriptional regulator